MNTDLRIQNFRIFDREGVTVDLRPVTVLTGCNNSGKSSIVKSLCLLKDFCQQIQTDMEDGKTLHLENYKIDFHKHPNDLMGSFDSVLHQDREEQTQDSSETDDKCFSLEVVADSHFLLQWVKVRLSFGVQEWDELNNGYLRSYTISTLDGKEIFHAEYGKIGRMDFGIVKQSLMYFMYGQRAFSIWQNKCARGEVLGYVIKADDATFKEFWEIVLKTAKTLGDNAAVSCLEWQTSHCNRQWRDGTTGASGALLSEKVDASFVDKSLELGVWCYYPCLDMFKSMSKAEVRQTLEEKIKESVDPLSSLERKALNLFLSTFEQSEAETLHQFLSQEEDKRLFVDSDMICIGGGKFCWPNNSALKHEMPGQIYEESDILDKLTWPVILYVMGMISRLTGDKQSYTREDNYNRVDYHFMEPSIDSFLKDAVEDILNNICPGNILYTGATIIYQRRLYSLEDKDEFADTLKRFFEAKKNWMSGKYTDPFTKVVNEYTKKVVYQPGTFINKWVRQMNLGDHIELQPQVDGYGATIRLFADERDEKGMLLADKGYGILQLFVILLKIETAILETKIDAERYVHYTTGLPTDIIPMLPPYHQSHPCTVALEEPENHLHPSMQSYLADMVVEAYNEYGIHFIVETHSEYMIRKLQLLVSQQSITNSHISILYVNSAIRPSYMPAITDIGIEKDGNLKNEFGPGFFDESIRLSKELFKSTCDDQEG